jgi:Type I phosphodiesterase / nucleotide pyrophosphatase
VVRYTLTILCLLLSAVECACRNSQAQSVAPSDRQLQHYVVLVSLQGFGWDDARRFEARNLLALGRHGASAPEGMLPGYPALTSPSQFTIATGLYPGHHGIVADSFSDPAREASFSADDPKSAADGSWYGGTPIWSLAERQGESTACIGWIGCEAEIAGARPKYYATKAEPAAELRQIVAWLRLPQSKRPRLILAQFSEPAATARRFGPDALETRAAVRRIDATIGRLKAELDSTNLPIDLVVVSDRGLAKPDGGWITLDHYGDLNDVKNSGTLLYAQTDEVRNRVYNQLKKATSEFFVYRLKDLPAGLHLFKNPRVGDPVVYATGAYAIRAHASTAGVSSDLPRVVDGFDAHAVPEMKAIFFAAGPDIVEGRIVAPFESVNLYPWLAHLLALAPPKTDGSINILSGTLRDSGEAGDAALGQGNRE